MLDSDIYHSRANHEDLLHNGRTEILLQANAFAGIVAAIAKEPYLILLLSPVFILINSAWMAWSSDAVAYVAELRRKGANRLDQQVWIKIIRPRRKIRQPILTPLMIVSRVIPACAIATWALIFLGAFIEMFK